MSQLRHSPESPCSCPATTRKRRSPRPWRASARRCPDATVYVYDNNSSDGTAQAAAKAGAIVRTERQQGKGHVVRRMFADVDADIYVMADGDLTYDPKAAPAMVEHAARRAARHGRRHPPARGEGGLSRRPCAREQALHRAARRACSGAASATFSPATASSRAASSRASRCSRRASRSRPRSASTRSSCAMPVGEIETVYAARPEGSESKLSTYRDGWRILKTIATLYRIERPVLFYGSYRRAAAGVGGRPRRSRSSSPISRPAWCRASRPRSWSPA